MTVSTGLRPRVSSRRPLLGLRSQPGRLALCVFRIPVWIYRRHPQWLPANTFVQFVHVGRRTEQPHETVAMVLHLDHTTGEIIVCAAWGERTDWLRNLRRRPALSVQLGRGVFAPQQRFLSADDAYEVARAFRATHPVRWRAINTLLGWHVHDDDSLHAFVRTHPFVAFSPSAR